MNLAVQSKLALGIRAARAAVPGCLLLTMLAACTQPTNNVAAAPNLPLAENAGNARPSEQASAPTAWHPRFVRNVTRASVDLYLPEPADASARAAMLVCPGGAFRFLSIDGEGDAVARWLNGKGIAAFVLHYRLKPTPRSDLRFFLRMLFELPPLLSGKSIGEVKPLAAPAVADATQALRFVRERASSWHLDARRVGIVGFSAGGMVAVGAALAAEPAERPDFAAALYSGPVDLAAVPSDAPPLFAAAAADDPLTAIATRPIAAAWKAGGASVELHLYQNGGHGFGFGRKGADSDRWLADFSAWLERMLSART